MQPNRVARILGIEKPVVQGPLSWLTDARLVAAVGNAGGLGVLGPNAGLTAATAVSTPEATAEKMREEIRKTKQLTEKHFGVNLIPTAENDIWTPAILPVIKEEGVKVVVYTGYGDGSLKPALFDELKAAGITIIYRDINPTPENSRRAEQAGADIKPTQSAICAVMLYDAKLSQIYAARMQEEGIYVTGFYYPVVPKDQARIRVQISAGHEKEHLDKCIAAFIKVGKELGVLK